MAAKAKEGASTAPKDSPWWEWTVSEYRDMLVQHVKVNKSFGRTICAWGQRGIGKSDAVKQAAKATGARLVDKRVSQMDPADLRGVLMGDINSAATMARWLLNPDFFPTLEKDQPLIIHLDEFNHAVDLVQKASFEIAWDHAIGGTPLADRTTLILSGNRESENADVTPMSKPMQRRVIHCYIKYDYASFFDYAMNSGRFHPLVLGALKERPDWTNQPNDGPDPEYYGEALPASWEVVSDIERHFTAGTHRDKLVAGAVGPGMAIQYRAWAETAGKLTPLIDAIEKGSNDVAERMDQQWFVVLSLVERFRSNDRLAKRIVDYAMAIREKVSEMGGLLFQQSYKANGAKMKEVADFRKALVFYSKYIV